MDRASLDDGVSRLAQANGTNIQLQFDFARQNDSVIDAVGPVHRRDAAGQHFAHADHRAAVERQTRIALTPVGIVIKVDRNFRRRPDRGHGGIAARNDDGHKLLVAAKYRTAAFVVICDSPSPTISISRRSAMQDEPISRTAR